MVDIIWTASGLARPPSEAATPADMTNTPWSSNWLIWQPSRLARSCRQIASAIGLRQVLPVQTKSIIRLASRCKVFSGTTPCAEDFVTIAPRRGPPTKALRSGMARRPAPDRPARPRRRSTSLGGDRLRLARQIGAGQDQRAGQHPQHVQDHLVPRHAEPDGPRGTTICWTAGGSRRSRLSGWQSSTTNVTGPGQHRRASRWARPLMSGDEIAGLVSALDGQTQRMAGATALHFHQPPHAPLVQGAGRHPIDSLGGKGHELPLHQRLNGLVDNVSPSSALAVRSPPAT